MKLDHNSGVITFTPFEHELYSAMLKFAELRDELASANECKRQINEKLDDMVRRWRA